MTGLQVIDCAAALDRAPFFVLGALSPSETAEVREHLASCGEPHPEFLELGSVVPYLAELVEPVDGGPELKRRVMEAVASDVRAQARDEQAAERLVASFGGPTRFAPDAVPVPEPVAAATTAPDPMAIADTTEPANAFAPADVTGKATAGPALWVDEPSYRKAAPGPASGTALAVSSNRGVSSYLRWALPAIAVLVIVGLGAWNFGLQGQVGDATRRADELRTAVAVSADPTARVARLTGSPAAPNAGGFAAFRTDGTGVLVVTGLPPAPDDKTYQAWFLKDGVPASAGLVRVERDGLIVVTGLRETDSIDGMAITLEKAGGVAQSTEQPLLVGTLTT